MFMAHLLKLICFQQLRAMRSSGLIPENVIYVVVRLSILDLLNICPRRAITIYLYGSVHSHLFAVEGRKA